MPATVVKNRSKVILSADVRFLGKAWEVKEVSPGYARNYLLPRGLAIPYSTGALKALEARRSVLEKDRQAEAKAALAVKTEVEKFQLEFTVLVDEKGDLYGSVSKSQILKALRSKDVSLPKGFELVIKEPIKALGMTHVPLRLHADVVAELKVNVSRGEPSKP